MAPPRLECGNPLLRDWVGEWMEEAKAMQMKSYFSYKKAHDSLSRCPMVFSHPCEAEQLNGIGPTLVKRLEQKMIQYCQDNGLPAPIRPKGKKRGHSQDTLTSTASPSDSAESSVKRKRAPRPYIPRYRTGPYAILLCLLDFKEQGQHNALKEEIINNGQVYCDVSMDLTEPGQNYTAWSGIKVLKEKGYVWQNGSPARFMLTESGETLAQQLRNASSGNQKSSTATTSASASSQNASCSSSINNTPKSRNRSSGLQSVWDEFLESQNNNNSNNNNKVDLSLYVLNPSEYQLASNSNMPSIATQITSYSQQNNNSNNNTSSSNQVSFSDVDGYNYNDFDLIDDSDSINLSDVTSIPIPNSNVNSHALTSDITTNNTQKQKQKVHLNSNSNSIIHNNNSENNNHIINNHSNEYNNTINSYSNSNNNSINHKNDHINLDDDDYDSQNPTLLFPSSSKKDKSISSTSSLLLPSTRQPEVITLLSPSPPPSSPIIQPISNQQDSSNQPLFHYTYLDINDKQVRHLSQASVKIDRDSHSLLYKIQFSSDQKHHSKVQQLKYVDESTCTGYIYEMIADLICSGLPPRPLLPLHEENQNSQLSVSSQTTNNKRFWPSDSEDIISSQPTIQNDSGDDYGWNTQSSFNDNDNDNNVNISSSSPSLYLINRLDRYDYDDMNNTQCTANSETVETTITTIDYVPSVKRDGKIWLPEDYTIMMVLDNREVKMKTNREYIQDTLCQKGVHVMKRALDLGDVIWVAKHKSTNEEMFLDIVVERKRLDDLVSSVRDGRYHEQKFRLKHSGSRKVIYIIEEYNREEINKYSGQQIRTSMSSVQAVDQFYLKRTNSLEETIDYLVCVTKMVEKLYENVKLQEIPPRLVTKENYIEIKRQLHEDNKKHQTNNNKPDLHYVISYSLYNQLNSKSGSSTLQDLYMKMLMTIRGVSAEKAYALIQHYPTPHQLLEAMDSSTIIEGKKIAMNATKDNLHRRRWTAQLSERLWNIWGQISSS